MGRSFYKKYLATGGSVNGLAKGLACPAEVTAKREPMVRVYSDVDVCKVLGLVRNELVKARKEQGSRGRDWDVVGRQVGMTEQWIRDAAKARGSDAEKILAGIKPARAEDGVVSCRVIGVWPNLERVTVEEIASGVRSIAEVPRIDRPPTIFDRQPMGIGWVFDALTSGNELRWVPHLNMFRYI